MKRAQIEKYFLVAVAVVLIAFVGYVIFKNSSKIICGDGRCQGKETCETCASDCPCEGLCQAGKCITPHGLCGDGICGSSENCKSCEADCPCPGTCGVDGKCETKPSCGNGICEGDENCRSCEADCPCGEGMACDQILGRCVRQASCGDGICGQNENCLDCPSDCPCDMGSYCDRDRKVCVEPVCGNRICEFFENQDSCCLDCPCSAKFMICLEGGCRYPSIALTDREAEQIAVSYLRDIGFTVQRTIDIADFAWDDVLVKKISFETVEQTAPIVVVVKENNEVEVLVTY